MPGAGPVSSDYDSEEWPKIIEEPVPCFSSKMKAIMLGGIALAVKEIEKFDDIEMSDEDFSTALQFFSGVYDDPLYILLRSGFRLPADSYEEACEWYEKVRLDPTLLKAESQNEIIAIFLGHFGGWYEEVLEKFHRAYKSLTVFITDDGRIATGQWVDK